MISSPTDPPHQTKEQFVCSPSKGVVQAMSTAKKLMDVSPNFSSSLNWNPNYTRTRHRNVRCFPCCLPQHKSRSFCGRSIPVHFTVPARDNSGKSISEGRVQCMEVYCCFRSMRLPVWLNVGQVCSEEAKDQHQEDLVVASFVSFDPDTRRAIFEARPPRKWQYTFQRHAPTSLYSDALDNDLHAFSAFVVDTETQTCWGQCNSPTFRIISSWKIAVPKSAPSSSAFKSARSASRKSAGLKRGYNSSSPDAGRGIKKERIAAGTQGGMRFAPPVAQHPYPNQMMSPNMYPLQQQQQQQQQGFYHPQQVGYAPNMGGGGMFNMPQMAGTPNMQPITGIMFQSPGSNMYQSNNMYTPNMYQAAPGSNPNLYPASGHNQSIYPSPMTTSMPMWMPANPNQQNCMQPMSAAPISAPMESPMAVNGSIGGGAPPTSAGMLAVPMLNNATGLVGYNNNNNYMISTPGNTAGGMSQLNPSKPVMPMLMPLAPQQQPQTNFAPMASAAAPAQMVTKTQPRPCAVVSNGVASGIENISAKAELSPSPRVVTTCISPPGIGTNALSVMASTAALQMELGAN